MARLERAAALHATPEFYRAPVDRPLMTERGELRAQRLISPRDRTALPAPRPKVSFDSGRIERRIELCLIAARAHRWHHDDIVAFNREVRQAMWYEDAMEVIEREFDTDVMG